MFISSQQVFSNVKSMLSSYDAAGLINDSDLFNYTRYVMDAVGTSAKKERSILIDIEGHQADLPGDFYLAQGVYICNVECEGGGGSYRGYYNNPVTYTIKDWYRSTCYVDCDVCFDNNEHYVTRTITKDFTSKPCKLTNRTPLELDKKITKQKCDPCCINLNTTCGYKFSIENNKIYTNFEVGSVNLEYYALPIDEDGYPEILEEPRIEEAVERYLVYKVLEKIYINGAADTLHRMQYAEAKYKEAMAEVMHFIKLPTWASMVAFSKKNKGYLDIFHVPSMADKDYNKNIKYNISKFTRDNISIGCN